MNDEARMWKSGAVLICLQAPGVCESGAEATAKCFASFEAARHSRQRLECGAFTAAFVRTRRLRINTNPRPHKEYGARA
jgi:hypothetical protein